jgi:hypothetical protein
MFYTLSYIEGNENPNRMPLDSYDTIQDCVDWAEENGVDYYLLSITEWGDVLDGYGTPEIEAAVNLQSIVDDGERESLSKYRIY